MLGSVSFGDIDWSDVMEKSEEEQREIVREMSREEGMSTEEIVRETDLEISTVEGLLST